MNRIYIIIFLVLILLSGLVGIAFAMNIGAWQTGGMNIGAWQSDSAAAPPAGRTRRFF